MHNVAAAINNSALTCAAAAAETTVQRDNMRHGGGVEPAARGCSAETYFDVFKLVEELEMEAEDMTEEQVLPDGPHLPPPD